MKKIFLSLFAVAMVILIALNVLISSFGDVKSSNVSLRGAAALSTEWGCGGHPTYRPNKSLQSIKFCTFGGTYKTCETEQDVCCNPLDETSCPGQ
jgi:hypothetical protein